MIEETFTPEEQEALSAMEADTGADFTPETEAAEIDAESKDAVEADPTADNAERVAQDATNKKPPEGYVPHGALHAEREERKKLQQQLEELTEWKKAQENPPEEPPAYVDPLEDPEGFRKYDAWQREQTNAQVQQFLEQQKQQHVASQRINEATQMEQEFAAKTPDYRDAAQHLLSSRVSELRAQGWPDQEISRQVQQDANGIYDAARAANINPAELLYYRAKAAGFAAKPQPQAQADQMQARATAQRNTQGLGQGGGAPQSGGLTAEQLAGMSEAEFAKIERENPDAIRKAMGG